MHSPGRYIYTKLHSKSERTALIPETKTRRHSQNYTWRQLSELLSEWFKVWSHLPLCQWESTQTQPGEIWCDFHTQIRNSGSCSYRIHSVCQQRAAGFDRDFIHHYTCMQNLSVLYVTLLTVLFQYHWDTIIIFFHIFSILNLFIILVILLFSDI